MAVTINEGTTFLISDDLGDVPEEGAFGLFSEDTRFLCLYRLLPPVPLGTQSVDYFAAEHFLTNPELSRAPTSTIGLVRSQMVGRGMREEITLTNYGDCEACFTLELRFAADFASIFDVKAQSMSGVAAARHASLEPAVCDGGRTQRFSMKRG